MKNAKLVIGIISAIVILLLVYVLIFSNSPIGEKISPIQIIKYSDENSSVTITKNNLDKSAIIKMELFMESSELQNEFMDLTDFTPNIMCGLLQLAFFDEEGLEEFTKEWNAMDGVVEDEEGEEIGTPKENVLEGYEVKKVEFYLKDKSEKNMLSECVIVGKTEENMQVKYY